MPCLAFNLNDGNEFIFDLLEERLSLGRNPRNEIVIDNNQISSFHAEFARQSGGAYVLTDLKSSNGTYVNGKRVESAELKLGDKVRFGQLEARFRDTHLPSPKESSAPNVQTIAPASPTPVGGIAIPKASSALSQIIAKNPLTTPQNRPGATQPIVLEPATNAKAASSDLLEQQTALKAEIAEARSQLQSLRDENAKYDRVKKESTAAALVLEKLQQEIESARKELAEQRQVEGQNRERAAKEAKASGEQLAGLERDIKTAEERLVALREESAVHSAVSKKITESNAQLESLATEHVAMEKEHAALTAKLNATQHEVERLAGQRDDHARELEKQSVVRVAKEGELAAFAAKLLTARQEFESYNRERVVHAKELDVLATQRSAQEKEQAELQARIEAAQQDHATLTKQQAEAGVKLQQTRQFQAGAEARIHSLQPEQIKLEALIKDYKEQTVRQQKQLESEKRELDEAITNRRQQLDKAEREFAEIESRSQAAEKRLEELAATESRLAAANKALQLLGEQQSAAEATLVGLKLSHEQVQKQVAATTADHHEVKNTHAETQQKLTLLQDEKAALEKSAASARDALVELKRRFAEQQAELQKSHAIKIQESDDALAAKQSVVDAASKRLQELEARNADLESKTALLAGVESKLAEARGKITEHESKQVELQASISELTAQRSTHEGEIGSLSVERERRNSEIKGLAAQEVELKKSAKAISDEVATARQRYEELRKLNGEAEQNFSARRSELERELADKQSSALVIEERITKLMGREEVLNTKLRDLSATESRLKEATNALSLVEEQKRALDGAITSLARQREEKEREITALAEQGSAQHTLTQTLSKQRVGLEENVATLESALEAAGKRLAGIETRSVELEKKSATHQAEIDKARAGVTQAAVELQSHRTEMLAVADAKEKHLAEHKEVKTQHAAVTKLLEETSTRHRAAESHTSAAEAEAKKQQAALDALLASLTEKSAVVASLDERHAMLTEAAAKLAAEEATRRDDLAKLEKQFEENAEILEAKRIELEEAGKNLSAAKAKSLELEQRLEEHNGIVQRLVEAKDSLVATRAAESDVRAKTELVRSERENLHQELLRLRNEAGAQGHALDTLRREHDTEKLRLQQTRDQLELENNRAQGVRNEIAVLLTTLASRQKDEQAAINQVAQAAERLTLLERRANELKDVEQQTLRAQASLDAISKQRLDELQAFDALTAQRDALSQNLARIEHDIADEEARESTAAEATQQRLTELAELEEHVAATRESLAQTQHAHEEVAQQLQSARSEAESTRATIASLNLEVAATQNTLGSQVAGLTKHVESLRREEDEIAMSLHTNRERLQRGDAALEELLNKITANETRYAGLLQSGDKLLSLNEALAMMETKERVASRHLSEAAEQELSLQVTLNALHESVAKEQQRLDQVRRERGHEEEDRARALEKAGRDLDEARHRAIEEVKQTEIQLTTKLKERVRELEEKHEVLRRSLHANMDEKTIILFANDLIKRIDLIDILIQRVTGPGINGGMEQQLRTLRASFEDILEQHGIAEFKVASGTEVDVDLRQRIAIVESVSGPAHPKVVESYRSGFMYSCEGGREVVLRKVEVKTSSE